MPVTIDSVTTTDAVASVEPHKISNISGEDTVTIVYTPDATVSAIEFRLGGTDQNTGTLMERKGRLQVGRFAVGAGKLVSSVTYSGQQTDDLTYSQAGGAADGTHAINIWQHVVDGAWS